MIALAEAKGFSKPIWERTISEPRWRVRGDREETWGTMEEPVAEERQGIGCGLDADQQPTFPLLDQALLLRQKKTVWAVGSLPSSAF